MTWYIEECDKEFETALDVANWVWSESDFETDQFEDYLDDEYGQVEIAGHNFWTSNALRELDENAYYCMFNDWVSDMVAQKREDLIYDLEHMDADEEIESNGYIIMCLDDCDESYEPEEKEPEAEDQEEKEFTINDLLNILF